MRRLWLLLILAACLAAASCRSQKVASTRPLSAPSPETKTALQHHGLPSADSSGGGLTNSPAAVSSHEASLPVANEPLSQQQAVVNTAITSAKVPIATRIGTEAESNVTTCSAPMRPDLWRVGTVGTAQVEQKPVPRVILLPYDSNISTNASASGIQRRPLPIDLWGSLTSTPHRAVTTAPGRFHDDPMSSEQLPNRISLPSVARLPAQNASPGDQGKEAIMIMDPLLKDTTTEEHRREEQIKRQEAERKAREAERENLNRAFYQFLLGK